MDETTIKIIVPIVTFVLGFFASRFSMSKKERKDYISNLQKHSNQLNEQREIKYKEFTQALYLYINKKTEPDLTDFFNIATSGDTYFSQIRVICDSILSDTIDKQAIKNTHLPIIKESVERLLPEYYSTLKSISEKREINFNGSLKQENYLSIYQVYDRYVKSKSNK